MNYYKCTIIVRLKDVYLQMFSIISMFSIAFVTIFGYLDSLFIALIILIVTPLMRALLYMCRKLRTL